MANRRQVQISITFELFVTNEHFIVPIFGQQHLRKKHVFSFDHISGSLVPLTSKFRQLFPYQEKCGMWHIYEDEVIFCNHHFLLATKRCTTFIPNQHVFCCLELDFILQSVPHKRGLLLLRPGVSLQFCLCTQGAGAPFHRNLVFILGFTLISVGQIHNCLKVLWKIF